MTQILHILSRILLEYNNINTAYNKANKSIISNNNQIQSTQIDSTIDNTDILYDMSTGIASPFVTYVPPPISRGQESLDDIIYTLAVNFLLYVVLIIVFYMLTRFYLEEETSIQSKHHIILKGYRLVSTVDDNIDDMDVDHIHHINTDSNTTSLDITNENHVLQSPSAYVISFFSGVTPNDQNNNTELIDLYNKIIFSCVGLCSVFAVWGLLQERILTQTYDGDFFEFSYGLVFFNRLLGLIFSAYLMVHFKITWVQVPLWEYSIPSVANMLSSWCQYEALKYVSFPTQTLAKAFKIIPVMLAGKLINGKAYETYEYVSAAIIGFGVYLFISSSESIDFRKNVFGDLGSINDGWCGVILLLLFLCFDSFTGQFQTRMFTVNSSMSPLQMMLIMNGFSALFSFITLVHQEELEKSFQFIYNHPQIYIHLILFCICSTVGQLFIYYTIKNFGAVVFSIIMALRILLSTLLSCYVYSHPMTELGFIGFIIVFGAIAYRIQRKMDGKPIIRLNQSKEDSMILTQELRDHIDV